RRFDTMRLFDVSQLYRPQEAAPEKFEEKPAPPLAGRHCRRSERRGRLFAYSGNRAQKYPASKAGDPYEAVWKRFFPERGGRLQTGRWRCRSTNSGAALTVRYIWQSLHRGALVVSR